MDNWNHDHEADRLSQCVGCRALADREMLVELVDAANAFGEDEARTWPTEHEDAFWSKVHTARKYLRATAR